ncbi:hypothetical protein FORMB_09610 [Formosa sp. Hel1_33_131]|uniref:hypothetical protein n=1 Tax=Formosa sp. Hel1_33_131 TaxID=1336794 RepID=UPI00086492B2|nr:hypothetical protein FORMB_09610 [Formosa sp. Hel1_33_131]
MMKYCFTILLLISFTHSWSQEVSSLYRTKKLAVSGILQIDSVSINPSNFSVSNLKNETISPSLYTIDFENALLTFPNTLETDSIVVTYLSYPSFITKTYQELDEGIIVNSTGNLQKLYQLSQPSSKRVVLPFDGLVSSGSISRGVTIGNNQNSVLNSELDLQISGKLNDKVTLRASIQDSNIPLQESGYSQQLDEFDQVFIEVFSERWGIRAGDIDLEDTQSYFSKFSKRVQGLSLTTNFKNEDSEFTAFASGALVRGQFSSSQFVGQEGNQGPYKLVGPNNELYVLVVSGSETVYVNGIPLQRGATEDYIIDYNAGELIFNATYPINSEMRITVDYQYSERNYSRFIGYAGSRYKNKKWTLGVSVYNENDLKNQPLQQSLNSEQVAILSNAGDDQTLMTAPSATPEAYNENRILYQKVIDNGVEVFEFSNNAEDELYLVNFTAVGSMQGNYKITSSNAISNIYEYVAPIAGIKQGDFEPIVQLVAPVKLQVAVVNGAFKPNEKTAIEFEFAASKNDLNLYSSLDDENDTGVAGQLSIDHQLLKTAGDWTLDVTSDIDYVQSDFRTIQRLYRPEFNRDWNVEPLTGNQSVPNLGDQVFAVAGAKFSHAQKGTFNYQFQHLNYKDNYEGRRHVLFTKLNLKRFQFYTNSSILETDGFNSNSMFYRSDNRLKYSYQKGWSGVKFSTEHNEKKDVVLNQLDPISQKFQAYEVFTGIGDSTKVFVKLGYIHRVNDSIQNNRLAKVNASDTYYLDSKWIQTQNTNLSLYANYRVFKSTNASTATQKSINSRLQYSQKLVNNLIHWNTLFETNAGRLPQQDFTYVEVEPGQGSFVWFDYNENGIQELEEFEIAQFQDLATYVRVLLPNQVYIPTHQNKLSQSLTLNPIQWANSTQASKRFWSHFYNQTSFLIDRKDKNNSASIRLNPFHSTSEDQLALQSNFRNQLFYNRGKQHYTVSYSYSESNARNVLSFGYVEQETFSHQLNFSHIIQEQWLLNLQTNLDKNKSASQNFSSKNYQLNETLLNPKLSYLLDDNKRFDVYYQHQKKDNSIGGLEQLTQEKYGVSFTLTQNQKAAITGEFNYFSNDFSGNANTPVAYQMMEGLQPGTNFTWSLIAQKKLTKFLDLNINYFGRKSETSRTIHTGTVQLKAYF